MEAAIATLPKGIPMYAWAVPWILFGLPLPALVFVWVRLFSNWKSDASIWSLIPLVLATCSTALADGALAYVLLVKPLPRDYLLEAWGVLISAPALISGLLWWRGERTLNSGITSAVSGWMLVLWFLMLSSA